MPLSPSPMHFYKHGKDQTHFGVTAFAKFLSLLQVFKSRQKDFECVFPFLATTRSDSSIYPLYPPTKQIMRATEHSKIDAISRRIHTKCSLLS